MVKDSIISKNLSKGLPATIHRGLAREEIPAHGDQRTLVYSADSPKNIRLHTAHVVASIYVLWKIPMVSGIC